MNITTMITAISKHAELKPPPTTESNSAHSITVSVLAMNTHNFAACAALLLLIKIPPSIKKSHEKAINKHINCKVYSKTWSEVPFEGVLYARKHRGEA